MKDNTGEPESDKHEMKDNKGQEIEKSEV